jgi:hypothetical protein
VPIPRVAGVLAACLLVSACGSGSAGSDGRSEAKVGKEDAQLIVLRLTDLPKGFRIGDDSCGQYGIEGASERMAAFVLNARPSGCERELNYTWAAHSGAPPLVESATMVLDDAAYAQRALDLRRDFLAFAFSLHRIEEGEAKADLGDEQSRSRPTTQP